MQNLVTQQSQPEAATPHHLHYRMQLSWCLLGLACTHVCLHSVSSGSACLHAALITTVIMHVHQCWSGRLSSHLLAALLQALANQVCEKVESKQRTTYNEVADELVSEFGNVEGTGQNSASLMSSKPA